MDSMTQYETTITHTTGSFTMEELIDFAFEESPLVLHPSQAAAAIARAFPPVANTMPSDNISTLESMTMSGEDIGRCARCDSHGPLVRVCLGATACMHRFCARCLHRYVSENVADRVTALPCPHRGCTYVLTTADVARLAGSGVAAQAYGARFLTLDYTTPPSNISAGQPQATEASGRLQLHLGSPLLKPVDVGYVLRLWQTQRRFVLYEASRQAGLAGSSSHHIRLEALASDPQNLVVALSCWSPKLAPEQEFTSARGYVMSLARIINTELLQPSSGMDAAKQLKKHARALLFISLPAPFVALLDDPNLNLQQLSRALMAMFVERLDAATPTLDSSAFFTQATTHIIYLESARSLTRELDAAVAPPMTPLQQSCTLAAASSSLGLLSLDATFP